MADKEVESLNFRQKEEPLVKFLQKIISYCVRFLAILMVVVILASIVDVIFILYDKLIVTKPLGYFHIEEILIILGAFIGVLIAIEIFNNIIVYLKEDFLHARLVLSTALIAVSRKVIITDYKATEPGYVYALAAVVLATAIAYWIIAHKSNPSR
jgi:uncharacterized membrane protein (DUF373 family)